MFLFLMLLVNVVLHQQAISVPQEMWKNGGSTEPLHEVAGTPQEISSGDHLCLGSVEHVVGSWKPINVTAKSFPCCGWDGNDYQNLGDVCVDSPFYMHSGGNSCSCDAQDGRFTVNRREKYVWAPQNCKLVPWDAHNFCTILANREVILVGDSTMQQAAATIGNMVKGYGEDPIDPKCSDQISFFHSDTLVNKKYSYFNRGKHWEEYINDFNTTLSAIVVLSAGPHIPTRTNFTEVLMKVEEGIHRIRRSYPGVSFMWKTQPAGHGGCTKYTEPLSQKQDTGQQEYNHGIFGDFDNMAAALFLDKIKAPLLNLDPLFYRADAHPGDDCLHLCIPGPLDLAGILLHHMLVTHQI